MASGGVLRGGGVAAPPSRSATGFAPVDQRGGGDGSGLVVPRAELLPGVGGEGGYAPPELRLERAGETGHFWGVWQTRRASACAPRLETTRCPPSASKPSASRSR